jgi:hypothetical protein
MRSPWVLLDDISISAKIVDVRGGRGGQVLAAESEAVEVGHMARSPTPPARTLYKEAQSEPGSSAFH